MFSQGCETFENNSGTLLQSEEFTLYAVKREYFEN